MSAIEPNITSLLWFALFWTLCCIGFLALSGSFPLSVARERGRASNAALAIFNGGLMAVLAALTLAYGYVELRISTLIVVMGLAFLFRAGLVRDLARALARRTRPACHAARVAGRRHHRAVPGRQRPARPRQLTERAMCHGRTRQKSGANNADVCESDHLSDRDTCRGCGLCPASASRTDRTKVRGHIPRDLHGRGHVDVPRSDA